MGDIATILRMLLDLAGKLVISQRQSVPILTHAAITSHSAVKHVPTTPEPPVPVINNCSNKNSNMGVSSIVADVHEQQQPVDHLFNSADHHHISTTATITHTITVPFIIITIIIILTITILTTHETTHSTSFHTFTTTVCS